MNLPQLPQHTPELHTDYPVGTKVYVVDQRSPYAGFHAIITGVLKKMYTLDVWLPDLECSRTSGVRLKKNKVVVEPPARLKIKRKWRQKQREAKMEQHSPSQGVVYTLLMIYIVMDPGAIPLPVSTAWALSIRCGNDTNICICFVCSGAFASVLGRELLPLVSRSVVVTPVEPLSMEPMRLHFTCQGADLRLTFI